MTQNFHEYSFYDYKNCRIAIKQTMKRHKGQRVRTLAYRFKIWTADNKHQYTSNKSESLPTESAALRAAQQIVDTIFKVLEKS